MQRVASLQSLRDLPQRQPCASCARSSHKVRGSLDVCERALTHDSVALEYWRATVEDKHRFDTIEEQLANATKKAENVCARERITIIVTHGCLELVEPYARVDRQRLAFEAFEPARAHSVRTCKTQVCARTEQGDRRGLRASRGP